jgi:glycosidase
MVDHLAIGGSAIVLPVWFRLCRLRKAMLSARQSGIEVLHIDSDPNALGFYRSLGAQEVAAVPAPIENEPKRVRPQLRLPTGGA